MNIVILGNGSSINNISNWNKIIKTANIVVRLKQGGIKKLYNRDLFKTEHHLVLQRSYYLRKFNFNEIEFIKKYYKVVFLKLSENEKKFIALNNIEEIIKSTPYTRHTSSSLRELTNSITNKTVLSLLQYNELKNIASKFKQPGINYSLGFLTILYYSLTYPTANINLYGFDFDKSKGWFWDKAHIHSKYHNFEMEKEILFNKLSLKNVFINDY